MAIRRLSDRTRARTAAILLSGSDLWLSCVVDKLHSFGATIRVSGIGPGATRDAVQTCRLRSDILRIDRLCDVTWIDGQTLFATFRTGAPGPGPTAMAAPAQVGASSAAETDG